MKTINHPNIVTFYDEEPHPKYIILKMEYIDGEPLTKFLLKSPKYEGMSVQQKRRFGVIVSLNYISALSALRTYHIANRDIKPDNIMVNVFDDGRILVKMVDLG